MKARTLDPEVKVYSSMDEHAMSIATLPKGSEIEFGGRKKAAGKIWVPITLSTGQQAYISGAARIQLIQLATILQKNVEMRAEPSKGSFVKKQLARKDKVYILQVIKGTENDWVKVRDIGGAEGYIAGDTRIRVIQQNTKALGAKNIRTGIMWLIAGLIIIFSGNVPASAGAYSWFGYAALLYGSVVLIMGLLQYFKAPS